MLLLLLTDLSYVKLVVAGPPRLLLQSQPKRVGRCDVFNRKDLPLVQSLTFSTNCGCSPQQSVVGNLKHFQLVLIDFIPFMYQIYAMNANCALTTNLESFLTQFSKTQNRMRSLRGKQGSSNSTWITNS